MTLLHLAVGALVVDAATAALLLGTGRGGTQVREWYRRYRGDAAAMDVLSLFIGTYLAVRIAPSSSLGIQLATAVLIQLAHDIAFGYAVQEFASASSPSPIMALFRKYAEEMGVYILWADGAMIISTLLVARLVLPRLSKRDVVALGGTIAYILLLTVHSY